MPQFTQWNVPSPFPNVLYNPAAVDQAANQTIEGRQKIGATDMEMVGRAAGSLLGMSEADAAAAYPGMIADLQRQGFARYAPPDYPGHAAVQGLVQRGLTVPQQYETGLLTAPGVTDALRAASAPLTSGNTGTGGGSGGGTYAPGTPFTPKMLPSGVSLDEDAMVRTIAGEATGEPLSGQIGVAHVIANRAKGAGVSPRDVVFSPNQFEPWNGGAARQRLEAMDPTSPSYQAILNNVVRPVMAGSAPDPTGGATHFYAPGAQAALGRDAPSWGQGTPSAVIGGHRFYNLGYGPAQAQPGGGTAAAPQPAPVVAPRPFNPNAGPRVVGAPPAGAPGAAPVAAPPQPGFGALTPVPGAPTVTGQADVPPVVAPSRQAMRLGGTAAAGPAAGPDTTLPPVEQPNQLYQTGLPGVTISGPASNALAPPAAAAPAPVAQAPAAVPAPPATRPATGQNSPQFQAALELNRRAQALDLVVDPTGRTKALAASLRAQAALYMQADSVSYDPVTGIGTKAITGERLNAAAPNAHYVWDADKGAYVDTSGTHPPVTPPSPRMTVTPAGDVIQARPGGGVNVVAPANPQDIATRKAAEAQGAGVGGDVAKQLPALAAQGRNAAQSIGNIDYGMSQLAKAQQGGINTGYFAGALTEAQSALKSIGVPTDKVPFINVDPSAIGNIQTAQKTLAIVSSAILKQALGDNSQITDAKIQHFIHAQPGIETDPQALGRVLNWARSQFVYENEMSTAAMKEAADSPTGTLPLNWQARYYRDKGFAPIYDPGSGEMRQPEGQAPSREPPPAPPTAAPVNASARKADTVYQTPKGPLKWTGTGWVAP
jgi:hypothetical protein